MRNTQGNILKFSFDFYRQSFIPRKNNILIKKLPACPTVEVFQNVASHCLIQRKKGRRKKIISSKFTH